MDPGALLEPQIRHHCSYRRPCPMHKFACVCFNALSVRNRARKVRHGGLISLHILCLQFIHAG